MWKTGQNKNVEIRKGRRVKQRCPSNSNLCLNQIIHTHTHTSRNCLSSPLIVASLTTAFISPEGEFLVRILTKEKEKHINETLFVTGYDKKYFFFKIK